MPMKNNQAETLVKPVKMTQLNGGMVGNEQTERPNK